MRIPLAVLALATSQLGACSRSLLPGSGESPMDSGTQEQAANAGNGGLLAPEASPSGAPSPSPPMVTMESQGASSMGSSGDAQPESRTMRAQSMDAEAAECVEQLCPELPASPLPQTPIARCCTAAGSCGVTLPAEDSCEPRFQPGEPSATCPEASLPPPSLLFLNLTPCCRPSGECGYFVGEPLFDIGCMERARVGEALFDAEFDSVRCDPDAAD